MGSQREYNTARGLIPADLGTVAFRVVRLYPWSPEPAAWSGLADWGAGATGSVSTDPYDALARAARYVMARAGIELGSGRPQIRTRPEPSYRLWEANP